jgi:NitT/TauT family transport system permease protein
VSDIKGGDMSTSITTALAADKLEGLPDKEKSARKLKESLSHDTLTNETEKNIDEVDACTDAYAKDAGSNAGMGDQSKSASLPMINKPKKSLPWDRYAIRTAAVIGAIIIWHFCSAYSFNFIISFENIPEPTVVGSQFLSLLSTQEFYTHIIVSLKRILIGFLLASFLGITAGVLMGRSKVMCDILMPYIEILRPIPAVAWIPLAILMLPTEESSIIYITFLGAFFPIVLNTVHGVEQTEETLVRAAKSLGATNAAILWHVILPGALPSIMAGLAIGMGVSWFSLLAGEIISGQYGIGYFTWNSYTLVEYPNIIIGMLVIGGLGTLSTWLVKQASKPALRWQEQQQ